MIYTELNTDISKINLLLAEHVFRFKIEIIKPEWYNREVYLFTDPDFAHHGISYSWDDNGCNAMMYRNGTDAANGTAPPLPSWAFDAEGREWEVVAEMFQNHGHRLWLTTSPTFTDKHSFVACFYTQASEVALGANKIEADRPDLVIALAALKALNKLDANARI